MGTFSSSSVALNPRASMMSNSTGFMSHRTMSISSGDQFGFGHVGPGFGGLRRDHLPHRTVGDIMVNNISAIDEAVVTNDTSSMFNKPANHFQNQHQMSGLGAHVSSTSPPMNSQISRVTSHNQDARSVISNASGSALHRISYCLPESDLEGSQAGNGGENRRHSTIQLLDANISDDEVDEMDDDIIEELDTNGFEHGVPENWLKEPRLDQVVLVLFILV